MLDSRYYFIPTKENSWLIAESLLALQLAVILTFTSPVSPIKTIIRQKNGLTNTRKLVPRRSLGFH